MAHRWVTDVLEDLRSFAEANAMIALAAKLEETICVARAEMEAKPGTTSVGRPPRSVN